MKSLFDPLPFDLAAAEKWLRDLAKSEYCYHIDDDPSDIIDRAGRRVFSPDQANSISRNLEQVRNLMTWDKAWEIYYAVAKENFNHG